MIFSQRLRFHSIRQSLLILRARYFIYSYIAATRHAMARRRALFSLRRISPLLGVDDDDDEGRWPR